MIITITREFETGLQAEHVFGYAKEYAEVDIKADVRFVGDDLVFDSLMVGSHHVPRSDLSEEEFFEILDKACAMQDKQRVEMLARFDFVPVHGWQCRGAWDAAKAQGKKLLSVPYTKTLFLVVSKIPPTGFCRRPHFYL